MTFAPPRTILTEEEAGILAALHAAAFEGLERPYDGGELMSLLDGRTGFVIADSALAPQGFVLCRTVAGEAEILVVAVAPQSRREGLGRELLAAGEAEAAARGATRIYLEVGAENFAARALYSSAGYAKLGVRRGYYRRPDGRTEDAILLVKSLSRTGQAPV